MSDWEVASDDSGSDWAVVDDVEEGGPESFLDPKKFKPSPRQRKLKNTGPIEQVRQQLDPRQVKGAQSFDENLAAASAPLLSYADRFSAGGLTGLLGVAKRINEMTGTTEPTLASRSLQSIQDFRGENPTLSQYTDLPAYVGPGIPRAIAGMAERTLPQSLGPLQRAVAGSGLTSGGVAGAEAITRGEDAPEVLREAGEAAAGGIAVGAPLALAGRGMGGLARKVTESKGGKARRFIEERGGGAEVGPTTPGRKGKFNEMDTKAHGDEGIGEQAEVSAERGLRMLSQERKRAMSSIGGRKAAIENTGEARQLRDVSDLVMKMEDALQDIDLSPQAEASLRSSLDKIRKQQGQHFNPETDNYLLSETDLNKLRRRLDRDAKTGTSTDEKLHPLKQAANEARSMVSEGPYADVNRDFSEQIGRFQESRGMLGINKRPKTPDEARASVNKVKNLIGRRGQGTITSGGQQANLREFEARHPDIAEEFQKPELLRKREDISFRLLPEHGGIHKTLGPLGHMVVHSLLHAGTGIVPALALTNRDAIAARLLYGPALAAQAAEPMLLNQVPLLAAGRRMNQEEAR